MKIITALVLASAAAAAGAIQIDMTNAGVQKINDTTLRLNNVKIPGDTKTYTGDFVWDSSRNVFALVTGTEQTSAKWKVSQQSITYSRSSVSFSKLPSQVCQEEFGVSFVQADWNDIVAWINNDPTKAQAFITAAGIAMVNGSPKGIGIAYQGLRTTTDGYTYWIFTGANRFNPEANILGGTLYRTISYWLGNDPYGQVLCNNIAVQ